VALLALLDAYLFSHMAIEAEAVHYLVSLFSFMTHRAGFNPFVIAFLVMAVDAIQLMVLVDLMGHFHRAHLAL
jgi:hypothetical protein